MCYDHDLKLKFDLIAKKVKCDMKLSTCGHCLTVIYSNIVPLNIKLFTKYLRRHPSKQICTKKPPEKLSRYLQEL